MKQCLEYRDRLRAIEPDVDYVMSLYLHEDITPEVIREAKKAGITGVKSYPAGVTTVSEVLPDNSPVHTDKKMDRVKGKIKTTSTTAVLIPHRTPPQASSPTNPSTPSSPKWRNKTWS